MEPAWDLTFPESLGPCRSRPCSLTELCVHLGNGNHACIIEMKSVDLTVLIDVTGNIDASDFKTIVDGVQLVIGQLYDVDVRLAVVDFGNTNPEVMFGLDQYLDEQSQLYALQGLSYTLKVGSFLTDGIRLVHDTVYTGLAGDRPEVQNVLLIMVFRNDIKQGGLVNTATAAKSAGIHIIAVGMKTTTKYGRDILDMVASLPLENNTVIAPSYEDLLDMGKEIADAIKLSLSWGP